MITVKEGLTIEGEIEITEGMRSNHSYISPYFITNAKAQWIDFKKPSILLSEKGISLLQSSIYSSFPRNRRSGLLPTHYHRRGRR